MCDSTLFHIRHKPNISLGKRTGLWYNQDRKAVLLWQIQNFVIYLGKAKAIKPSLIYYQLEFDEGGEYRL